MEMGLGESERIYDLNELTENADIARSIKGRRILISGHVVNNTTVYV